MRDIALADAIIVARPAARRHNAQVKVVRFDAREFTEFPLSFGACDARWRNAPLQRLGFLYEVAWHLTHVFKIPTATIHHALQAIPEYRMLEGNDR